MGSQEASHRISWWVYAGSERIPRTARMRGTWGYDVTCSCGWETRTGGAVKRYISDEVYFHKMLDK
jgi:hypothetical protein